MESSIQSERFTFGSVEDTQYMPFQSEENQGSQLPYNPFLFDLKLIIFKSKPNYEAIGTEIELETDSSTFLCRKKKVQKQWNTPKSKPKYLMAEIISQCHCSINEQYLLKDQNSKHGTFIWVSKQKPRKLLPKDVYLVGKQPLVILSANPPVIQFNNTTLSLPFKSVFLIGSHPKCHLVLPNLYSFEICINTSQMHIYTNLEEEEAALDHGLWYRLKQGQSISLENNFLFMLDPYIFKAVST